jgi:hypothetical protein
MRVVSAVGCPVYASVQETAESMIVNISTWAIKIAECWRFTQQNYPRLSGLQIAYIRHIVLHQTKDVGRMATAVEPIDHGGEIDATLLRRSTRNSLVNALRLCELVGWDPLDLLREYVRENRAEK